MTVDEQIETLEKLQRRRCTYKGQHSFRAVTPGEHEALSHVLTRLRSIQRHQERRGL